MTDKQKEDLKHKIDCLKILGWEHCHQCGRSCGRFEFYYQEQFDKICSNATDAICRFCDGPLKIYCEDGKAPYSCPEGWKVPSKVELESQLAELSEKFEYPLDINKFTIHDADPWGSSVT